MAKHDDADPTYLMMRRAVSDGIEDAVRRIAFSMMLNIILIGMLALTVWVVLR